MLTLLALSLLTQSDAHTSDRLTRLERTPGARVLGRNGGAALPAVGFARSGDTRGMTAECACTQPSIVLSTGATASVTTTRADPAYCTKADYSLVLCSANQARVMTGGGPSLPLGLLNEYYATTNTCLQNRDFTQAAWVKTNVTCTKTATGADLGVNAASTCTATANSGTVLQTVVVTGQQAMSVYVKRRTGTGTIEVTADNGTTWTNITSRLSSTIYKRVVNAETVGCMFGGCIVVRSMAYNVPVSVTLGFRFGTSGDAIDVDLAQIESLVSGGGGQFSSSPIATTTIPVSRGSELHSATVPAFTPRSASYYSVITGETTKYAITSSAQKDVNNEFSTSLDTSYGPLASSPFCFWVNGGSYQELYSSEVQPTMGPSWMSCYNDGTNVGLNLAGVTNTAATVVQPATAVTTLWLGARVGGSGGGVISNYCLDPVAAKCVATRNVTNNGVAWVGDSIATGSVSQPIMPPAELTQQIGRPVFNKGVPGCNASFCNGQYTGKIQGKGFVSLVYLCGTNDTLSGGAPAGAAAWTSTQGTVTTALADGLKVILFNILPYSGAAGFDPSKQAAIDAYNAGFATYCSANSGNPKLYCIDAYTIFGGGGTALLPQYDSGDGRHPNGVGSTFLATLAAAGNP